METTNIDPQQQRRRMRAALESMRRKRSLAVMGFVLALGLLMVAHIYTEFPDVVRWGMRLAAPIILLPLALPFLRSPCPKCNGRYHTITNLWRHPDHVPPVILAVSASISTFPCIDSDATVTSVARKLRERATFLSVLAGDVFANRGVAGLIRFRPEADIPTNGELKGRKRGIIGTPSLGTAMQGPHKASAHAPQKPSAPVPAATVSAPLARPADSADSAVSCVMQTTEVSSHPTSVFWDKWGPSGLAFFGVIVTLYGKWAFDAWKQKREIKRELYLKVADAMFEGGLLLGSFSNTDLPTGHFANVFARCMAPLAKAEMVAGNKLLLALSDLRDKFGPAYFSLFRERARIEPLLTRLRNRLPFVQQATDKINANLAEQNRLAIEGVEPGETQERFGRLQESFRRAMDERQGYYNDNAKDIDVINPACEGMNRLALDYAHQLIPARVRVLAMMRKELKFRFNERQYLQRQIKMAEKAMAELDLTHQAIRDSVKPRVDDSGQGKGE